MSKSLRSRKEFSRFSDDESGGITIYSLVTMIMMLVVGGMAVDFMRHEIARADLQNALDRGVLAATNLEQDLENVDINVVDADGNVTTVRLTEKEAAELIINQYVASQAFPTPGATINVAVSPIAGGRTISASVDYDVDTIFLRMMGQDDLEVGVGAGAEQAIFNTEITLILDVSGSMGRNSTSAPGTKLAQLKAAAKSFVQKVLANDTEGRTLISIVPYSAQVAVPPVMAAMYNFNRDHNFSTCFEHADLDYRDVQMPMNTAKPFGQSQQFIDAIQNDGTVIHGCPKQNNAITPFLADYDSLADAIDALTTENWTASYVGMKWGAALLDPSSRAIVAQRIADKELPDTFAGWPLNWDDTDARKFTVLMTDGVNTRLNGIRENVYDDPGRGADYYHENVGGKERIRVIDNEATRRPLESPKGNVIQTGDGDEILQDICAAIQNQNLQQSVIFTIGFELNPANQPNARAAENARVAGDQLRDCATSLATHYNVEGEGLTTAFNAIAEEVIRLRLSK